MGFGIRLTRFNLQNGCESLEDDGHNFSYNATKQLDECIEVFASVQGQEFRAKLSTSSSFSLPKTAFLQVSGSVWHSSCNERINPLKRCNQIEEICRILTRIGVKVGKLTSKIGSRRGETDMGQGGKVGGAGVGGLFDGGHDG